MALLPARSIRFAALMTLALLGAAACGERPSSAARSGAALTSCTDCHGAPPPSHTLSPAGSGGSGNFADCAACHAGDTATSIDPVTHEDGIVQYALGATSCAICHGSPPPFSSASHPQDPLAGASAFACGNCHTGYTATTVSSTLHRNGIGDASVTCASCHGNPPLVTASGVMHTTWTACGDCHPQTSLNSVGVTETHRNGVPEAIAECFGCHGLPPPPPHVASTDCGLCHPSATTLALHPNGIVEYDLGPTTCNLCHGAPPAAPHPSRTDCGSCHPGYTATTVSPTCHLDGLTDCQQPCTSCHGDATRANAAIAPAPPLDIYGNTATTAPGVGAHQAHLVAGTLRAAMACTDCHVVPASPAHPNGVIELTWSPLARAGGVTPTYNGSSCSNYCHGSSLGAANGSNHAPSWTIVNGTQDACGTCHGVAPTGRPSTGGHASSSHASLACTSCHTGTASSTSTTHVNGAVELLASLGWNATTRSCAPSCHASQPWNPAPPPSPPISMWPEPLAFGAVPVGTAKTLALTVINNGVTALSVSSIIPCTGTTPGFTVSPTTLTVPSGATGTVDVTWTPRVAGPVASASCIAFFSNAARNPYNVILTGTAVPPLVPIISATPNPLDFGYQPRWRGARSLALTVANGGTATLNVTRVARCSGTSDEFSIPPDAFSIPAGGTRTVTVSYDPYDGGADAGCVELTSDDATRSPYRVTVTGTSVNPAAPRIATSPTSLSFGTVPIGSSRSLALTVANEGTATLEVSGISRCSGTSDEFRVWTSGFSVAPGASRQVPVTYRPGGSGTDAGCVAVTSNDPARPRLEVPLSGTGAGWSHD